MDYSPTLCFAGFNSKRRKFQQERKEKNNCSSLCRDRVMCVATEFCVSRQTSKQMAKEICHDNISSVAKQRTEYRRRAMSRQKIACRDRTWEECNKSVETKIVDVATRFASWMSTPRRICCDIKAHVTTLETRK